MKSTKEQEEGSSINAQTEKNMTNLTTLGIAPINIKSDIKKNVLITDNIYLQKFTENDLKLIKESNNSSFFSLFNFKELDLISSCKYKIVVKNSSQQEFNAILTILNKTIRLIKLGSSGVFVEKYLINSSIMEFTTKRVIIPSWALLPITEINSSDISLFQDLFNQISLNENEKFNLMINKYIFATSGLSIPNENRFIDLISILEILYLPDDNTELKFRLSLRLAKVFKKEFNEDIESIYEKIRKFYNIRSDIVHKGKSKQLNKENLLDLSEITRKSILLYLNNPDYFKNDKNPLKMDLNKILLN